MCKIVSFAVPASDAYGNLYAGGASVAQSQCQTHQWSFPRGVPVWDGLLCPIGQIEDATKKAIEEIKRAKGSN